MPPHRYAVGIDLGGSKLRGGILSRAAQRIARLQIDLDPLILDGGIVSTVPSSVEALAPRVQAEATVIAVDASVERAGLNGSTEVSGAIDRMRAGG